MKKLFARGLDVTPTGAVGKETLHRRTKGLCDLYLKKWKRHPMKDQKLPATTNFAAGPWSFPSDLGHAADDFPLVDLARGVTKFPQDDGRRLLTRAVQHAQANGHNNVQLRDLQTYAAQHGLAASAGMVAGDNPDLSALKKFKAKWHGAHP